jgi:hypothetical protein
MRVGAPERFLLRLGAYVVAVALCQAAIGIAVRRTHWTVVLWEGGFVEQAQFAVLVGVCLGFLAAARRSPPRVGLYLALAWLALCAAFRESDYLPVYRVLPTSELRLAAGLAGLAAIALLARRTLPAEARALAGRPACLLLVLGAALVLLWAQILGDRAVWRLLYAEYAAGARLVEEGLELSGYVILLCAVLEEHLDLARPDAPGARGP